MLQQRKIKLEIHASLENRFCKNFFKFVIECSGTGSPNMKGNRQFAQKDKLCCYFCTEV